MRLACFVLGLWMALAAPTALADGGGGGGGNRMGMEGPTVDPVLVAAEQGIAKADWVATQALLKSAVQAHPDNADYHNLYAYTTRKGPKPDMALVFAEYAEALRINPGHLGAHEYLGEAYLQVNDLAKAREQLAALDKLCFFGCEAYSDLKRAVKQYETDHPR